MKKLDLYTTDDVITLTTDYGMIADEEAHLLNEAEEEMFVTIRFGTNAILMKKSDIRYMVESEVHDA